VRERSPDIYKAQNSSTKPDDITTHPEMSSAAVIYPDYIIVWVSTAHFQLGPRFTGKYPSFPVSQAFSNKISGNTGWGFSRALK